MNIIDQRGVSSLFHMPQDTYKYSPMQNQCPVKASKGSTCPKAQDSRVVPAAHGQPPRTDQTNPTQLNATEITQAVVLESVI